MIRLAASVSDHGFVFTSARDGVLILTTGNRQEAANRMGTLGIDEPDQLLDAAERWGAVEVHADAAAIGSCPEIRLRI